MAGLLARLLTLAQLLGELHDRGRSRAVVVKLVEQLVLGLQNALARPCQLSDHRLPVGPCASRCVSGPMGEGSGLRTWSGSSISHVDFELVGSDARNWR